MTINKKTDKNPFQKIILDNNKRFHEEDFGYSDLEDCLLDWENSINHLQSMIMRKTLTFSLKEYHKLYWEENESGNTHFECYENIKNEIFQKFLEVLNAESLKPHMRINFEFTREYCLQNLLMRNLVLRKGVGWYIHKISEKYKIPDSLYHKIVAASGFTKKLNDNQKNIIGQYKQGLFRRRPFISYNDNKWLVHSYKELYNNDFLVIDLLALLYFLGEEETEPSTYLSCFRNVDKRSFDKFIVALWVWAQNEKPPTRKIPPDLKETCIKILVIIRENNNQTKYTNRDFNIKSIDSSWKNFQNAVNDSRRRIRDLSPK